MYELPSSMIYLLMIPASALGRCLGEAFSRCGSKRLEYRTFTFLTFLLIFVGLLFIIFFSWHSRLGFIAKFFCIDYIFYSGHGWKKFKEEKGQGNDLKRGEQND